MSRRNNLKTGVLLSYALLILNTFYGLMVAPFILKHVGIGDYGVYKTIASMSASLAVMDLGLGSTMTRYMAKYHARQEKEESENFAAMIFVQFCVLALAILSVGTIVYFSVQSIYGNTFTVAEIGLAKKLVILLILNMTLRLFENLLSGIASGYERFTVVNGVKIAGLILKFTCVFVLLPIVKNVLLIVLLETVIVSAGIFFFWVYIRKELGIIPHLKRWDKGLFRESMGYTLLMFVQTLTIQFNGNVDNILIGARISSASVTIYSMALVIFGMYENLSGSIAKIMLPNMMKRIEANQSPEQLQKSVEKAGRYQFMLLAAALGGFIVLGKDCFTLWLGNGFEDCYWLTLILIVPVTFTMMQNVSLSILRAKNKMGYRTATLAISCVINIISSWIGIALWGYWGAAIGTALATICNLIFMNIYYHRRLEFRVFSLFAHIMGRTLFCAIAATIVTGILHLWLHSTWISMIVNIIVFMTVYVGLMLIWGINKEDKRILLGKFGR